MSTRQNYCESAVVFGWTSFFFFFNSDLTAKPIRAHPKLIPSNMGDGLPKADTQKSCRYKKT